MSKSRDNSPLPASQSDAGSSADIQSQLNELQKRFTNTPSRSNPLALSPDSDASSPSSRRSRALRTARRTPSDVAKPDVSTNSPGRVDFLSDLSDGLLVESRRLAYENKKCKAEILKLNNEKQSLQIQTANLNVMNKKLTEKEEETENRVWELESELDDTKEDLQKANVAIDQLKASTKLTKSQLGELSSDLETSQAQKQQQDSLAASKVSELSERVKNLTQSNTDLNDENDALSKQVQELKDAQVTIKRIDFSDLVKEVGDNEDVTFDDNDSILFAPEPAEKSDLPVDQLERETLEANLRHAISTIQRLRSYVVHTRQESVVAPGLSGVRRRLFTPTGPPADRSRSLVESDDDVEDEHIANVSGDVQIVPAPEYEQLKAAKATVDHPDLDFVLQAAGNYGLLTVSTEENEERQAKVSSLEKQVAEKDASLSSVAFLKSQLSKQGYTAMTNEERDELEEQVKETKNELASVQLEVSGKNSEFIALQKVLDQSTKDNTDLQQQVKDHNEVKDALKTHKDELSKTQGQLSGAQKKLSAIESKLESTEKQLTTTNSQLEAARDAHRDSSAMVTDLQKQLKESSSEVASLRQQLGTSNRQLTDVQKQLNDLQQSHESPDEKYLQSKSALLGLTTISVDEHKQLKDQSEQLAPTQKALDAANGDLQQRNAALAGIQQEFEIKIAALERAENELTATKEAKTSEIDALEKSLFVKQEEYENTKKQLADITANYSDIQSKHENPDAAYIQAKSAEIELVAVPKEKYDSTAKELDSLKEKLDASEKANASTSAELASTKAALESSEKELSSVQASYKKPTIDYLTAGLAALGFTSISTKDKQALEKNVSDQTTLVEQRDSEVATLKQQLNSKSLELDDVKERLAQKESDPTIKLQDEQMQKLREQLLESESQVQTLTIQQKKYDDVEYLKQKSAEKGLVAVPTSEKESSEKQAKELNDKLNALEQQLSIRDQEAAASEKQIQALTTELSSVTEAHGIKSKEIQTKSAELESKNIELQTTSESLTKVSEELKQKTTQLDQANASLKQLESEHASPNEDYVKSKLSAYGLVAVPDSEYKQLKEQSATQQKQLESQKQQIVELNSSTKDSGYLTKQCAALGLTAITATAYASLQKQLSDKSAAAESDEVQIKDLTAKLQQSEASVQETKTQLDRISAQSAANEQLLADKSQKIAELNGQLAERSQLVDKHSSDLEQSQKEISQMKQSMDSPDITYLQSKAGLLGAQVVSAEEYHQLVSDSNELKELDLSARAKDEGKVLVDKSKYNQMRDASDRMAMPSMDFLIAKLNAQGYKAVDATDYDELVEEKQKLQKSQLPVSNNEFNEVLRSLRVLGGDFTTAADQLTRGNTDGLTTLQSAAASERQMASCYEAPTIDYVQNAASKLGLKSLTMGEYLDLKDTNDSDEEDDEEASSQVSEEPIEDMADVKKSLKVKSKNVAVMQKELQTKEKELATLRECMEGGEAVEGSDEKLAKIATIRKQLADERHSLALLKSELGQTQHKSGKRRSLKQISQVDQQLDMKRRQLQVEKENLEAEKVQAYKELQNSPESAEKKEMYDQVSIALVNKSSALQVLEAYIASNKKEAEEAGGKGKKSQLKDEISTKEQNCEQLSKQLDNYVADYVPILDQKDEEIRQLKESLATESAEVTQLEAKIEVPKKEPEFVAKTDYDAAMRECQMQERELQRLRLRPDQMAQKLEAMGYTITAPGETAPMAGYTTRSIPTTGGPGSSTDVSDYEDAVSSQRGSSQELNFEEPGDITETTETTETRLREQASRMGYTLVPMDDIDTTTIGTAEIAEARGPDSGTYRSNSIGLQSPVFSRMSHQPSSLSHQPSNVSASNLATLAASLDLALVPTSELSELKKRQPATAEDLAASARDHNLICIPDSQFVPTTVCRHPDPTNVMVVPSSYYTKLIKSHEWCKTHKGKESQGPQMAVSTMDMSSIQSSAPGTVANVPRATNAAPENSPAFALAQLKQKASQLDSYSLHTFNTVITTKQEMIAAITQTIIGEYLFKYYRKMGPFSSVSESRHERYFWIHPYSLTLYWSATNPSLCDPSENKVRALAIAKVRSVDDNNPLPPGLYHKSIIISGNDRQSVKITCPTRQRHNIWYNSIKFLLEKSTENIVDDSAEENQYSENFTLDQRTILERTQSSFRHQQPRGSILGTLRRARGEQR